MRKYIRLIVLLFMVLITFTGCQETPLSEKSIDEIIIMCLEDTYPEHQFHVVSSYNMQKDEGTFADENGIEFSVHNILINNRYHFGCTDEYLNTLLMQQNYMQILEDIDNKYDAGISCMEYDVSIKVDLCEEIDLHNVAEMILEIYNSVEIPQIVFPKKLDFSTGEINYYTKPNGDILLCDFVDEAGKIRGYTLFHFSDNEKSIKMIERELSEVLNRIYENDESADFQGENKEEESEERTNVTTDYGNYIVPNGWGLDETYSTEELNIYTEEGVVF